MEQDVINLKTVVHLATARPFIYKKQIRGIYGAWSETINLCCATLYAF